MRTSILQLLAGKDQALLVRGDTLLILNLRLDVIDGVASLDVKSDGLASQCFHENLHASTQAQNKMERRLLLDVVIGERTSILQLLAGKDQALLVRGDTLLILNLRLDVIDGVASLDVK